MSCQGSESCAMRMVVGDEEVESREGGGGAAERVRALRAIRLAACGANGALVAGSVASGEDARLGVAGDGAGIPGARRRDDERLLWHGSPRGCSASARSSRFSMTFTTRPRSEHRLGCGLRLEERGRATGRRRAAVWSRGVSPGGACVVEEGGRGGKGPRREQESNGAGQWPRIDRGLVGAAVLMVRTGCSEVADQTAFLVVLVIQGVGEYFDERSVRAGRLLGL